MKRWLAVAVLLLVYAIGGVVLAKAEAEARKHDQCCIDYNVPAP